MNVTTTEVAPDLFRLSLFVPEFNLQFNQFLVRDEEPLLYHNGMRKMFPAYPVVFGPVPPGRAGGTVDGS